MKNNKLKILSLLAVCAISLCACNDETIDDSGNEEVDEEDENTESSGELTLYQYYAMYPTSNYYGSTTTSAGSFSHNGLTWSHDETSYLNTDTTNNRGLQIGSNSNPVSNYALSTDFGETVLLDNIVISVAANSNRNGSFSITFDNSTIASKVSFSGIDIVEFSYEDLSLEGSSLSFSFTGSGAVYVKSIGLGVYTTENSKLSLSADTSTSGDGVGPGARKYTATSESELVSYYSDITNDMSGDALKSALNELTKLQTSYTYGEARYDLQYTDEVVGKPGYMYSAYDGEEIEADWYYGSVWNREHVWPQSRLGETGALSASTIDSRSDLHNLRACTTKTNGEKGDDFVGNIDQAGTYYVNAGEGDHRGDVARICFYMYVRYPENGLELINYVDSSSGTTYGLLDTMLSWNTADPVDDFEKQRNSRIEEYQGNRNPFIDHPEYASRLFA